MTEHLVIDHVCRVEGHGGITVTIEEGRLQEVRMDILEGSRFYEALLGGKHYSNVATVISRVCAICSGAHTIAAQMAVEDAFGISVSERTRRLRGLLLRGGTIESHALHLFLLVAPDLGGYPSALDMAKDYPDLVRYGLSIKKLGNDIQDLVGGRAIHPVNVMIGRFGKLPPGGELRRLRERLERILEERERITSLLEIFAGPEKNGTAETYMALEPDNQNYGLIGTTIQVSNGDRHSYRNFHRVCSERVVKHSPAKQSVYSDHSFMVGAQARMVLNGHQIRNRARAFMESLSLRHGDFDTGNPLDNNMAQGIELIQSMEAAVDHIDAVLTFGFGAEAPPAVKPRAGVGVGALEAPRGTLYHKYSFDENGVVLDCDIITPTAQNLANIDEHLRERANRLLTAGEKEIGRELQILVRAYDPCISCSVHVVDRNEI